MITKIGILSKETFDKKIKIKKDSRKQSAIGSVAAYGLTDTLGLGLSKRLDIPTKVSDALAAKASERMLKGMGIADLTQQDLSNAREKIKAIQQAGEASRPANHFTNKGITKFLRGRAIHWLPGLGATSTYIATRNSDLNQDDDGNRKVAPWVQTSAMAVLPDAAGALERANAYSRGVSALEDAAPSSITLKGLKKAKPLVYSSIIAKRLLPHVIGNAAGYGVAKLQDKGIDAYNKFQDKRYADTEALLKARRKAKEKA